MMLGRVITKLCKECEALLLEMDKGGNLDGDAIDCCLRRLYRIRYIVAPLWNKKNIYKE